MTAAMGLFKRFLAKDFMADRHMARLCVDNKGYIYIYFTYSATDPAFNVL